MFLRTLAAVVMVTLAFFASPVHAQEEPATGPVAANAVVTSDLVKEAGGSRTLKALFVSYGVVQGFDMASTIHARNRGAVEANPLMRGNYATGLAVKAAFGAVTMLTINQMEKKSKKAAILTMIGINVGTAAVIAHNIRNARRLK